VWLRPADGTPLAAGLEHAVDGEEALARAFALGTPADVAGVWVDGAAITTTAAPRGVARDDLEMVP
jgi:guanine deaminase